VVFNNDLRILRFLLDDLINHPNLNGAFLEIWHDREVLDPEEYSKRGFKFTPHLNFIIPLDIGVENVWNNIQKRRREHIKHYNPLIQMRQVTSENDIIHCYHIIKDTYKRIKIPLLDYSVFLDIFRSGIGLFFIAEKEGKPIAAQVRLAFNKCMYAWFAGDRRDVGNLHANDCLHWESMKYGAENDYSIFNFGGAGKPGVKYGVRDHKATFGGELVNFGRHRYTLSKISSRLMKTLLLVRKILIN